MLATVACVWSSGDEVGLQFETGVYQSQKKKKKEGKKKMCCSLM